MVRCGMPRNPLLAAMGRQAGTEFVPSQLPALQYIQHPYHEDKPARLPEVFMITAGGESTSSEIVPRTASLASYSTRGALYHQRQKLQFGAAFRLN